MTNNDVLRSLRYTFRMNEDAIKKIFENVEVDNVDSQISSWLKQENQEGYELCTDENLSNFLNGYILENRGKKSADDPTPKPEAKINNNLIFKKLKIALNLQSDDVLNILQLADFNLGKHELTAFFRKEGHKNYRECKDQILRNFLLGLTIKYRT